VIRRRLLHTSPEVQPDGSVTLLHDFSLANDPYLQDHRLDGQPVLPVAGAAEWIAQFVQEAWPDFVVTELRDLRTLKGLVLNADAQQRVLFRAKASSHAAADALTVTAELLAPVGQAVYYRGFAVLRPAALPPPRADVRPLSAGRPMAAADAYRDFLFHGERFRLIHAIERLDAGGVDAVVQPSTPAAWIPGLATAFADPIGTQQAWLFDPGLVDTAPQLAIVWSRVLHDRTPLPSRIGALVRYGDAPLSGPLKLALRVNAARTDDTSMVYDTVIVDADGHTRLELREVEGTASSALNRLAASA
jgi:hypothetical protein